MKGIEKGRGEEDNDGRGGSAKRSMITFRHSSIEVQWGGERCLCLCLCFATEAAKSAAVKANALKTITNTVKRKRIREEEDRRGLKAAVKEFSRTWPGKDYAFS